MNLILHKPNSFSGVEHISNGFSIQMATRNNKVFSLNHQLLYLTQFSILWTDVLPNLTGSLELPHTEHTEISS